MCWTMTKLEEIQKALDSEGFNEELQEFLEAKRTYIREPVLANRGDMLMAYQLVYSNLKHLWVNGVISETDFRIAADDLQEGLD